jgi:hypothetical protein
MYPLGLCVFCTYGPNAFREAASLLSLGAVRTPNPVGRRLAPAVPMQNKFFNYLMG